VPEWTPNQLAAWQALDVELEPVVSALTAGRTPTNEEVIAWPAVTKRLMVDFERLKLVDGVVYRKWYDKHGVEIGQHLLAPKQIRAKILEAAHDGQVAGHYAVKQTLRKVREHFYWPGIMADVRHYCRSCVVCQQRRPAPKRPHHALVQDRVGEPMQRLTIDIMGFERATPRGNRYVLVMVDTLSKWAEAVPMPDERAETVAGLLVEHVVCRLGVPMQIHSDQGRQFESAVFQQMCGLLGIRKTRTTPLHPQSDGQTERLNRTLLDLLSKLAIDCPGDWDLKLQFAMAAYRSTPHSTTGETPNRLMLGREVNTPLSLLAPVEPDGGDRNVWVEKLHENFAEAYIRVQEQVGKAQRLQKRGHDRYQKGYTFEEGQRVWLLDARAPRGVPYKLNPWRWKGPYEIRKRISAAVYVVGLPGSRLTRVVNVDRLKQCVDRRNLVIEGDGIDQAEAEEEQQPEADDNRQDVVAEQQAVTSADEHDGLVEGPDVVAEAGEPAAGYIEVCGKDHQTKWWYKTRTETQTRPQRQKRRPGRFAEYDLAEDDE
jgi:hypothetical protein